MDNVKIFHFIVVALAGWVNRHQQAIIDYLIEENRVFKQQLQGRRLRLSDDDRRRLAAKAKALGREVLDEVANLVTPDTLLAWYRNLIGRKWTYSRKGPGRPPVSPEITELVLRIASENASWGYDKIQGALANLGHTVSSSTVANILKRHGIEPAPERGKRTSWRTFLKAHWEVMAATDFFTIEVWTPRGLVTYYVLFVMHLATRKISIAGATTEPNAAFMMQIARNVTDEFDGFLRNHRYLIMDRDTKFTGAFRDALKRAGVEPVRCPPRAPTCNAYAERFVRSIKSECLERMILLGERSLRRALREYSTHYLSERNHQGVGNQLLEPRNVVAFAPEPVQRRERLGGMLSFYYREAA
jgi:transposase InsO family protein